MDLAEFNYALPDELIGRVPASPRDSARLLDTTGQPFADRHVRDLPDLVGDGDVVVLNDTRVRPARLQFRRPSGGSAEVLLLRHLDRRWWECLVRPSARIPPGTEYDIGPLHVTFGEDLGEGRRRCAFDGPDVDQALQAVGEMPLPPYLSGVELPDPERYQTVFSRRVGSVAAPTAGLHFTTATLDRIVAAGAHVAMLELQVGVGTFRPVTTPRIEDHIMHAERFVIPEETWSAVTSAKRVIAIGTTVTRALESAARTGCLEGETSLYLKRGDAFSIVDLLVTNFHLPQSSLLILLDAFMGPAWRTAYSTAIDRGYRMLSFGDAMLAKRWT